MEVTCPKCDTEFEVELWENGECQCGNEYYFHECCLDDYSDCWPEIDWEDWGV